MIRKILIIDDERIWGSLTKRMLAVERPECCVNTAVESTEGLAMALSFQPDVIILDVMLPGLNGWEVAARLKANERTRDIPIIMASGAGSPYDNSPHVEKDLITDYLRKPFDVQMLLSVIDRVDKQGC